MSFQSRNNVIRVYSSLTHLSTTHEEVFHSALPSPSKHDALCVLQLECHEICFSFPLEKVSFLDTTGCDAMPKERKQ